MVGVPGGETSLAGDPVALGSATADGEGEAPGDGVGDGEAAGDALAGGDVAGDGEAAGDAVADGDVAGEGEAAGDAVADALGDGEAAGDAFADGDVVGEGEAGGLGVAARGLTAGDAPAAGTVVATTEEPGQTPSTGRVSNCTLPAYRAAFRLAGGRTARSSRPASPGQSTCALSLANRAGAPAITRSMHCNESAVRPKHASNSSATGTVGSALPVSSSACKRSNWTAMPIPLLPVLRTVGRPPGGAQSKSPATIDGFPGTTSPHSMALKSISRFTKQATST